MTSMDNWERGMESLEQTQQSLQAFLQTLCNHHEQVRPGRRPLQGYITDEIGPGGTISLVDNNTLHPNALLAALLHRQIEFNKTVIQMLTDLDYRKSEP